MSPSNLYICVLGARSCPFVVGEMGKRAVSKVIERVEARYDVQDVEFGRVYKWHPESVLIECECEERLSLSASATFCRACGADHTVLSKRRSWLSGCTRTKSYTPGATLGRIDKTQGSLSEEEDDS
jgi:hypothetical protein